VEVEAVFSKPEDYRQLLPGYSADLEIILETRDDVLRIPTEALLPASSAGQRVLVYDPAAGTLHERRISAGISNWKYTEVLDGLQQGEQVVVTVDRAGVQPGAAANIE
jgi:HlyD family secretion protein